MKLSLIAATLVTIAASVIAAPHPADSEVVEDLFRRQPPNRPGHIIYPHRWLPPPPAGRRLQQRPIPSSVKLAPLGVTHNQQSGPLDRLPAINRHSASASHHQEARPRSPPAQPERDHTADHGFTAEELRETRNLNDFAGSAAYQMFLRHPIDSNGEKHWDNIINRHSADVHTAQAKAEHHNEVAVLGAAHPDWGKKIDDDRKWAEDSRRRVQETLRTCHALGH